MNTAHSHSMTYTLTCVNGSPPYGPFAFVDDVGNFARPGFELWTMRIGAERPEKLIGIVTVEHCQRWALECARRVEKSPAARQISRNTAFALWRSNVIKISIIKTAGMLIGQAVDGVLIHLFGIKPPGEASERAYQAAMATAPQAVGKHARKASECALEAVETRHGSIERLYERRWQGTKFLEIVSGN